MGLWDSITDFFTKIEYDKNEAKKKEEELNNWLAKQQEKEDLKRKEEYDNGFKNGLPEEKEFEYKEVKVDDDKVIEEKANNEYKNEWDLSKEDLENKYSQEVENYNSKAEDYSDSAKKQHEKIEENYEVNKDKVQNNAIKNGLVNSSILSESKEELGKLKEVSLIENFSDLEKKIKKIDDEIEKLSVEKELKKNRLDSDYRKKIDAKINSLKSDRQKEIDKIEKYNKEVAAQEKEYAKDLKDYEKEYNEKWQKSLKEQEEYARQNGYVGEKKNDYDNRLKNAYDFYSQLPKKDATEMIQNNPNLRKYLGYNYARLLRDINK